ncbi:MAG: DUF3224 domain-containing protein [Gemmatimonadaceae bacterium]
MSTESTRTNSSARAGARVIAAIGLSLAFASPSLAQTHAPAPKSIQTGSAMTARASGSFDVKVIPQGTPDNADPDALGRMTIDKQFHGDLAGTSKGEMLATSTSAHGSAVYVAIERVTGTLRGRSGSFVLMHQGTMTRDAQQLTVTVAPASGTGALVGLAGTMTITIVGKQHLYELEYTLPGTP